MKRVGLESFAGIFFRYTAEGSGADEVYSHGERKNDDGHKARVHVVRRMEEQPLKCLPDNVERGQQQQARFDERGKALHFSVAVEVLRVRGFVRNADRKIGDYGGYEVQDGMQSLRENTEAAGNCREKNLQGHKHDG